MSQQRSPTSVSPQPVTVTVSSPPSSTATTITTERRSNPFGLLQKLADDLTGGVKNTKRRKWITAGIVSALSAALAVVGLVVARFVYDKYVLQGKRYYCVTDATSGAATSQCTLIDPSMAPSTCSSKGYMFKWWCEKMACKVPAQGAMWYGQYTCEKGAQPVFTGKCVQSASAPRDPSNSWKKQVGYPTEAQCVIANTTPKPSSGSSLIASIRTTATAL